MFVIESCQKIEYNALFMMIFIPVSNFGDQPLHKYIQLKYFWNQRAPARSVQLEAVYLKALLYFICPNDFAEHLLSSTCDVYPATGPKSP